MSQPQQQPTNQQQGGSGTMEESTEPSASLPAPPQSAHQQHQPQQQQQQQPQSQQQEPVNFNPSYGRRVTIGGMHGNIDRRGSLASVGMEDLFGRRPSMGLDVGMDNLFDRRASMDSTAAALDAAFLDLTRRRSSLFLGQGAPPTTDLQSHDSQLLRPSLAASSSLTGATNAPFGSPAGGFDRATMQLPPQFNIPQPPPPPPPQAAVSSIAARQKQLQQQQRELEQYQKVLELQRQQLLANMQERSYEMNNMQQPGKSRFGSLAGGAANMGGSIGFGPTATGSMGLGASGSLGLGSVHSQGSGYGFAAAAAASQAPHRPSGGSNQNWWICQICNAKAFSSREEAMTHEAVCQHQRTDSMASQLGGSMRGDLSHRNFSMGMDSSAHSAHSMQSYDTSNLPNANMMSTGPFAMLQSPMPLAMDSDKDWLTPLHCFVRKCCVEVFTASEQDVATPSKGKRKPIQVGQIGIRCPHCHVFDASTQRSRERGSVYYPTTISSIYNATMNLLQRHLHSCPAVPQDIMRRYETLKADDARSGTSKRYWVESALSLGLVDTPHGIRYSALRPPPLPSLTLQQATTGQEASRRNSNEFFSSKSNAVTDSKNAPGSGAGGKSTDAEGSMPRAEQDMADSAPLITPEDRPYSTTFSYHLLSQMQPCVFTEADRLGKRKGLPPGFPGLACRHCFGGYGSGRFFPSSIKTLSDTSKTLNVLHNHMMRCRKCPTEVRETLETLRKTHDEERAKMKFGSQKAFFGRIWERLHGSSAGSKFVVNKRPLEPARSQQPPQQFLPHPGMHAGFAVASPPVTTMGPPVPMPQTQGPPQQGQQDAKRQKTA